MRKYLGTSVLMFAAIMVSGACLGTFEAKAEEASVHPADTDENWQLVMSEAIAYLAGWQGGSNPMAYAIRAAYLWQNGERYHYDAAEDPPVCWALGPEADEGEYVEGEGEFESEEITFMLPDDIPLILVRVPAGSFLMGSLESERSSNADEKPIHPVEINYDFYIGKYEVTQGQWQAIMETSLWTEYGVGNNYPAYSVSWTNAHNFIDALNDYLISSGQDIGTIRLPSEAEWEYACRAGTQTRFPFGDSLSVGDECEDDVIRRQYMWYCCGETQPVGGKLPNTFGLHDMSGNVREWCQDWYHSSYTFAPADGSAWESPTGSDRVTRGGDWTGVDGAKGCRSASRSAYSPDHRDAWPCLGLRLAASPAVR